ncbi:hypothetical protein BC941DRAFT_427607 [Chlamydoabsidia padenii]|nr:hypothetical protein BC941DRAFT_427607 [Chlamydoabsidia padenii]
MNILKSRINAAFKLKLCKIKISFSLFFIFLLATTMKRKRQLTQKNDTNTFSVNQPRCTICLQGFTNRTFVRDCFHSFCFVCIRQWINITPDCPLCKSAIQALIYNIVEDLNSYQEYRLADKKPNTTKHHPSSTPCTSMAQRHLQIRPWLKRRQVLYRYLPTVITYPPPQPHLSSITIIQPQHMPKVFKKKKKSRDCDQLTRVFFLLRLYPSSSLNYRQSLAQHMILLSKLTYKTSF